MRNKLFFFAAFVFLSAATLCAQHEKIAIFPFKSDVFIKEWMVLGPFPAGGDKNLFTDFLTEHGGEANIYPQAGMEHSGAAVPSGRVQWRVMPADDDGKLDFVKHLNPNQSNIAYAAVIVRCDKDAPALLKLGSNDMLVVWLNGERVYVFPDPRASGPDVDKIAVNLKKGDNLLMAKVQNVGGGWWLYARFQELFSVDETVYASGPIFSAVPKRTDRGIADMFSVMLYNASNRVAGPVRMFIGKEQSAAGTLAEIKPGATTWLNGSIVTAKESYEKGTILKTEIRVATAEGERTFPVKVQREPLVDGTTWFVQGFHVDPVWRDSQSGYQALSFSNLSQYLYSAQGDPDYDFFMSEIPYLKPYYNAYPEDRALIRRFVSEGRVETGGSYNQPNETTISGEGLVRNILYGRLFHENVMGDYPHTYQPWDVFGHIIQLPQILAKSEFIGTAWERSNYRSPNNVKVPGLPDLCFAQSPDGTALLTRRVSYGFGDPGGGMANEAEIITREEMSDFLKEQQEQISGIEFDFRLNAVDEKAPSAWMVGRCSMFDSFIPRVRVDADGSEQYFEHVQKQYEEEGLDIPFTTRDVSQYNEGCELSRFDLKAGNRYGENTIITAEKFATFANVMGMPYPDKALDKAWRQLLYGQHHDGITGCGADVPYLDLTAAYHETLELGGNSLDTALDFIIKKTKLTHKNGEAVPVVVFNPLNWERDDIAFADIEFSNPVKGFRLIDSDGHDVPVAVEKVEKDSDDIKKVQIMFVAKDVPSVGYKTWWVVPGTVGPADQPKPENGQKSMENEFYKITVDERLGGGIGSITDKATGEEYISTANGHPANELILLKEGTGFEPAWRFLTTGKKIFSKDYPVTKIQKYSTPVYEKMVIHGEMERMKERVQEITLYKGLRRVEFRTYLIDYEGLDGKNIIESEKRPRKDDRDFYVVSFPANSRGSVPVVEDRFATKTYYHSKDYLEYSSTDVYWTTHHGMNSSHQWMDYSYSVRVDFGDGNSIALGPSEIVTTRDKGLRKAGFRLQTALGRRGITSTPAYPDVRRDFDIQYRRFSFSAGSEGKNEYNEKLIKNLDKVQKRTIREQIRKQGYAYAFVYDTGLQEAWFDYPVLMIIGKDEKLTEQAMDSLVRQLEETGDITLPAEAWMAGRSNVVDKKGLAVINRGNLPVSVEPDGSMVLALMHTIPWQSPLLQWTHDFPERKTHVFDYALYPHGGNWQEAGVVRQGYEYNNPLIAVQAAQHNGELPDTHSFISTGNAQCVISAVKPASMGIEAFSAKKKTSAAQGVVIRLYEPEGQKEDVTVRMNIPVKGVQQVNLMERHGKDIPHENDGFSIALNPYTIETFMVQAAVQPEEEGGYNPVPEYPVYARFWEQNEGAAPYGYTPVNVVILPGPEVDAETSRRNIRQIRVAVTNDYTDAPVTGTIQIETPPGVRAVPSEMPYEVGPNSEAFYPVTIILEGHVQPGFIKASIVHEKMTIFDVLEFRLPPKRFGHAENEMPESNRIAWTVSEKDGKVTVMLTNPFAQPVDGMVTMIGPVESWKDCRTNPLGLWKVSPWQQPFTLPAKGTTELHFDIKKPASMGEKAIWLVAKLSYFGYLDYKPAVGELEIRE